MYKKDLLRNGEPAFPSIAVAAGGTIGQIVQREVAKPTPDPYLTCLLPMLRQIKHAQLSLLESMQELTISPASGNQWLSSEEELTLHDTEPTIITYEFMPLQHNSVEPGKQMVEYCGGGGSVSSRYGSGCNCSCCNSGSSHADFSQ